MPSVGLSFLDQESRGIWGHYLANIAWQCNQQTFLLYSTSKNFIIRGIDFFFKKNFLQNHFTLVTIFQLTCQQFLILVMFYTTDSTPSLSLFKTLHRCIVDHHHYQSYSPFAHLDNSHTSLGPLALYYMWKYLYPIFSTSHVNRLCSTHVYLFSILEYGHAQRKYHMFSFPCHMFVLLFHMLLLIIPHAISKSSTCLLPFVTHYVSDLQYISIEYLSCIFLSFEYQI